CAFSRASVDEFKNQETVLRLRAAPLKRDRTNNSAEAVSGLGYCQKPLNCGNRNRQRESSLNNHRIHAEHIAMHIRERPAGIARSQPQIALYPCRLSEAP